MYNKLVSVIIPTFKSSDDVIYRAVDSVLNQTYKNIEIIVVDDNSSEWAERATTEQAMKKYEKVDKVFYLKHEKNRNGSAARNTGIKFSHGDYIAFLDDDDWFLPQKIEKQVSFLETNEEFQGVYCLAQRNQTPIPTIPYEGDVSKELLLMKSQMFTPSLCFRREAILAINGFDERFRRHQDFEFLLRFFESGSRMGCVKEILIELGTNGINNMNTPRKAYELKRRFLDTFMPTIIKINTTTPDFKNNVISTHYGKVLVMAIRKVDIYTAILVFSKHIWLSPLVFLNPLFEYCKDYIKRRF